jgi:hypothetical protein
MKSLRILTQQKKGWKKKVDTSTQKQCTPKNRSWQPTHNVMNYYSKGLSPTDAQFRKEPAFNFDGRKLIEYTNGKDTIDFIYSKFRLILFTQCSARNNYQFVENDPEILSGEILESFLMIQSVAESTPIYKEFEHMRKTIIDDLEKFDHTEKGKIMMVWKNVIKNLDDMTKNQNVDEGLQKLVLTLFGVLPIVTIYLKKLCNP